MNEAKNILVPVDLSDNSLHSVLYALSLAKHNQSKVEVFYSTIVPVVYGQAAYFGDGFGDDNAMMMAEVYHMEDANAKKKIGAFKNLVQERAKEHDLSNVPLTYNFQFGNAIPDINIEAKSNNIDLIIVGIHDHNDPSKLINDISGKLLRNAKVPVLAVPKGVNYQSIKNIVYTTNYHKHSVDEIQQFLNFVKPLGAKTHCLHLGDMLNEKQQMDANIKPYFEGNDAIDFHLVTETDLVEGIAHFIKHHNIQLIGMHPHKTTVLGQLFGKNRLESILQHVAVPVLSVH